MQISLNVYDKYAKMLLFFYFRLQVARNNAMDVVLKMARGGSRVPDRF